MADAQYNIQDIPASYWIFSVCVTVLLIIAMWKVFEKAGEAGWKSLIPIYNAYTLVKIADGNGWKFLLLVIPFVDIVYIIMLNYRLSKSFGRGIGYALGLLFLSPIFELLLAFGSAQYIGPRGEAA